MKQHLSRDQFEALEQVRTLPKSNKSAQGTKPSACIARNGKFLTGIKLLSHHRDGSYTLTDKGHEALFVKNCITGLRNIADDVNAKPAADITAFLVRKSYIAATATPGRFEITAKGRECLADIADNP